MSGGLGTFISKDLKTIFRTHLYAQEQLLPPANQCNKWGHLCNTVHKMLSLCVLMFILEYDLNDSAHKCCVLVLFIPAWLSESHCPLCDENKVYESIIPEVRPRNSVKKTQNRQNDPMLLLAFVANKRKTDFLSCCCII